MSVRKGNIRAMVTINNENIDKLKELKEYFNTKQISKAINESIRIAYNFYIKN